MKVKKYKIDKLKRKLIFNELLRETEGFKNISVSHEVGKLYKIVSKFEAMRLFSSKRRKSLILKPSGSGGSI